MRRFVTVVAVLVTIASIVILGLLYSYDLFQKKSLNDLNNNINSEVTDLQQKPDISKILTVQNQLGSLTSLHSSKPAVNRLFDTYLNEITPSSVDLNSLDMDFTQYIGSLTGTADSLSTVDKYVDTLKFTTYTSTNVPDKTNAFSNVVLTSFGVDSKAKDPSQAASFTITFSFDKNIFDVTQNVNMTVPNLVTTRSELEQPTNLFQDASSKANDPGGQ